MSGPVDLILISTAGSVATVAPLLDHRGDPRHAEFVCLLADRPRVAKSVKLLLLAPRVLGVARLCLGLRGPPSGRLPRRHEHILWPTHSLPLVLGGSARRGSHGDDCSHGCLASTVR